MKSKDDVQRGLGVLHKNRDHMFCYESWLREGTLFDYLEIKPEMLAILPKLIEQVTKKIGDEYFTGGKLVGVDETYFDFDYGNEPEFNVSKILELSRGGYFDKACEFLLNDPSCEDQREFLYNRGVTDEDILENKLGSSKYVSDEYKDLLGLSVHPMTRRYLGGEEVTGVMIPFMWNGEVIALTTRAVPFDFMKFSTTAPDLTLGNRDEAYREDLNELWVVEGKFDQMALNRIGIDGVLFLNSASPSVLQLGSILSHVLRTGKRLVLALDSDNAGMRSMLLFGTLAQDVGIDVRYVLLLGGKDHAEAVIKYGFGIREYGDFMYSDVNHLKSLVRLDSEPDIVEYDDYVKKRKEINVNFKDGEPGC